MLEKQPDKIYIKNMCSACFSPSLRHRAQSIAGPSTGVLKRLVFYNKLERHLSQPENLPCKLIVFDTDRFKQVNELFGIRTGDEVLRFIGKSARDFLRKGEFIGHLWCDVFAMCVRRSDAEAVELMNRINSKVNELPLDFDFILSAGVLNIDRFGGEAPEVLCSHAEQALQTVKGDYIKRTAFYDGSIQQGYAKIHFIVSNMVTALNNGEFNVFLQPQVDLRTGRMVSAEALVRWIKDGRIITPDEFIPLFEKNRFVLKMDEYVWDLACRLLQKWLDRGLEPPPISVNVSRAHIYDREFSAKIQSLLQKYHFAPELMPLEITESIYVEDSDRVLNVMKQMRDQGYIFEIDDFGSGYSSLSMLQNIPVNGIKLDLRFLRASENEKAGRVIIKAIIDAAHRLDVSVMAEGVETEEQVRFLRKSGCDMAQGYYFGKPMSVDDFEKKYLIRSSQNELFV